MATRSKTAATLPEDRLAHLLAQLDEARREFADAEATSKQLIANYHDEVERVHTLPAQLKLAEIEHTLLRHVGKSRRRFFPVGKTVKRRTGSVQRKWTPPAVDFRRQTAEETLRLARERGAGEFLRIVPAVIELNLEAIQANPEGAKAAIGVGVYRREQVRVTTPFSRASYVLKGREVLTRLRLASEGLRQTPKAS